MPQISDSYDEDENRNENQDPLWAHCIKATLPRMKMIEIMRGEEHPISVPDLNKKLPQYNRASIHRTLELFAKSGIVNKIQIKNTNALYELMFDRNHHHHLICTECGFIEDSEKCLPNGVAQAVLLNSENFATVSRHSLEFFGIYECGGGALS